MMGVSTRIVFVPIPASQKLSGQLRRSRSPREAQKTAPFDCAKVFTGSSQDLAYPDTSPHCQAKLTDFSYFLTNNGKQLPFFVRKATIGKVFARSDSPSLVLRPSAVAFEAADTHPKWRKFPMQLSCLTTRVKAPSDSKVRHLDHKS